MVKPREPDVAIVAAPLVAVFVVFVVACVGITVSLSGCGVSSGRHFGSIDGDVSTGHGGSSSGDAGGFIGFRGMAASGGSEQPGDADGGTTATGGSGGAASGGATSGGVSGGGGRVGSGGMSASGGAPGTGGGSGGAATGGKGTGGTGTGGGATGGAATGGAATGGAATGGAATGGAATGGAGTGGAATGGAGTGGAATGGAGTGGAATGGAGTGGAVATCRVTVNEIQTGTVGAASDEFVELYNTCSVPLNLSGYSLNYRSAANNSGGADIALFIFPTGSEVPGHGFVVLAGTGFGGPVGGRFQTGGLAAVGGAVAVRNASGAIVDAVAYEVLTTANFFTEALPAVTPPATSSIVRIPDGADTDNNAHDFRISLVATPSAINQ
jgi:hypothetical protein